MSRSRPVSADRILGNAGSTQTLTFAANDVPPNVTASNDSCIDPTNVDPDAGFQECEFRFPPTVVGARGYQHLHRETWKVFGPGSIDIVRKETTYASSKWRVVSGGGSSFNNNFNGGQWEASWTVTRVERAAATKVRDESAQQQQSANRANSALTTTVEVTQTGSGSVRPPPTLSEYQWENRIAPRSAPRIEGFDVKVGVSSYLWPGLGQIAGSPTIACRWSFPAAPVP